MNCSGAGYDTQADQYKRRRDSVLAAKALADAGYKVFVIGMGSNMPDYLKNTLNWMAYYGSSDNPLVENGGDETAFDPAAVSSCGTSSTTGTCDGSSTNCFATSNDPGALTLSGYAFLANNATELEAAFRQAISVIREATYSFYAGLRGLVAAHRRELHLRGGLPAHQRRPLLAGSFDEVPDQQ